jgi:hypothetical protein
MNQELFIKHAARVDGAAAGGACRCACHGGSPPRVMARCSSAAPGGNIAAMGR